MKDAHILLILHNSYFQLPEEPCPTLDVLALHKSKCKWDDLILPILTYGCEDLTLVLASEKCAINTYHRSTMSESFNAGTEREEQPMQHPNRWELWQVQLLDVNIRARIPVLQCLHEPNNRVICIKI